jgi:F0F1-type ATP synthase membrane subunit b/b'
VDVDTVLTRLEALIRDARAVPMSASCVVHRDDVLDLIEDARRSLPNQLGDAQKVLTQRDSVIAEAREQAKTIIDAAYVEQSRLVSQDEVSRQAAIEGERIIHEAQLDADSKQQEVDDYVDGKLANFEVVLDKTLKAVKRGREKIRGAQPVDDLGLTGEIPLPGPEDGLEELR